MRLTRTNRIIIAAAGVLILFLLLFPPWRVNGYAVGDASHRMFLTYGRWKDDLRVDTHVLTVEIAVVVVGAGVLMVLLHRNPKPKPEPDKDA